jgi:hypothetical protein
MCSASIAALEDEDDDEYEYDLYGESDHLLKPTVAQYR